ncbi:hypothetical protein LMG33818_001955 [Halomonadaceae bacterium LMG 33818]|uniref:APC family permease n=1 Tax=Cernens ardua TaxID=3402176 RepID=UPI003EDBB440
MSINNNTQTHRTDSVRSPIGLKKDSIGIAHVVFFVIAAAAPMTAVIGVTPAAMAYGNGAGVPGTFIIAGIIYLLFSRPYSAMSLYIQKAGAFYEYVTVGLGAALGRASGVMAVLAYFSVQLSIYSLLGIFMRNTMLGIDVSLPWWLWTLITQIFIFIFGLRNIEISGRILGICMIAEIAILLLLDVAILLHGGGPQGIGLTGFGISQVFSPGLGASMALVMGAFIGFEATAIFAEEAKTPKRTIPRATYSAVIVITAFYTLSSWTILQYYGVENIQEAARANPNTLYFNAAHMLLGHWAVDIMNLLMLSSMFACLLSFHNSLNRYLYSLGRYMKVYRGLSHLHQQHKSPYIAGIVQSSAIIITLFLCGISRVDVYSTVYLWMAGIAIIAIVAVQILVMISAMVFFRRIEHHFSIMTSIITPVLACLGLGICLGLIISRLGLLTGIHGLSTWVFPGVVIIAAVIGIGTGTRKKT